MEKQRLQLGAVVVLLTAEAFAALAILLTVVGHV